MRFPPTLHLSSSRSPVSLQSADNQSPTNQPVKNQLPRQPDWLLIMVGLLVLLTLLIAWLVDIP